MRYSDEKMARGPVPAPWAAARSVAMKLVGYGLCLLIAVAAFAAFEHYKVQGATRLSWACLAAAGGFGLAPLRAILGELLAVEGIVLHLIHGFGSLAFLGLGLSGVVSGGPLLSHAPFALMGAAQAVMHQDHPRTPEQALALRRFVSSLPEVEQFAKGGNLTSPVNVHQEIAVLTDLVSKAQTLGQTELKSDPGFQSAIQRVTTRAGLTLGLDTVDRALDKLAANPAAASAIPPLRKRLAAARKSIG